MGGVWQRAATFCGCGALLASRGLAHPLGSLNREHWIPLDSAATDQTTDVATGAGGSMVFISGYMPQGTPSADGSQNVDAILMAYNSSGTRQWAVQHGGSEGEVLGNSVAADSSSVYLAGTASVQSNDTGSDDQEDTDAFVIKYDSAGELLWRTSWGTSEPDLGNGVAVDGGSGRVYVVGTTRGSMGAADTRKTTTTSSSSETATGTAADDEREENGGEGGSGSVQLGGDAAGADTATANAGASDVFLTCLDAADGEIQWTVQFGSSTADVGNRVAVGPRGGVFLVGQLGDDDDPSLAGARAFLAKYDYLGNSQFTARLNSSSTHYAVDLAPSLGTGGEGVVYMSGYTLGDSPSVFLARFEGSTGTQTWLSRLGEDSGMPHLAQAVVVIEGSQHGGGATDGGGGVSGSSSNEGEGMGGSTGAGVPVVEDEEDVADGGSDARVVVVGYNTSAASAASHSSTGFTAAANTNGEWDWYSVSHMADRETAIAVGGGGSNSGASTGHGPFAFIVGSVASSEASPGNYLFLDIQEVVRETPPTQPPTPSSSSTPAPSVRNADRMGEASATTGLSQGSSLWLLIIAPIFVVVSCILMVGYVSKQCAIAFGKVAQDPHEPMDSMELSPHRGDDGEAGVAPWRGSSRNSGRKLSAEWDDGGLPRFGSGRSKRRKKRRGKGETRTWSARSIAAAVREKVEGPPYRKLGTKDRVGSGLGARGGEDRGDSFRREGGGSAEEEAGRGGEVELGVTSHHRPLSIESSPRRIQGRGGSPSERSDNRDGDEMLDSLGHEGVGDGSAWEAFEVEAVDSNTDAGASALHHTNGNPRGDEPADGGTDVSESSFPGRPQLLY